MNKYDIVLFDLDGTITQSADGIRKCIELTLTDMKKPIPDMSDYSRYIGPPLLYTFGEGLCRLSDEKAKEALPIYNAYYNKIGIENNFLFDGIRETVEKIKSKGIKVAVCSSKNEALAKRVADYLEISDLFDCICGSKTDGTRKEKKDAIPYTLSLLNAKENMRVVLVGDTAFDAIGAKACFIDFIGVTYGYGKKSDMSAQGVKNFADTPKDILKFIL